MPWYCLCKLTNLDTAAACSCGKAPILAPVKAGRAAEAAIDQTREQFRSEDLEKTIFPAYKKLFEDTEPVKTAGMRMHVARALIFARALRGYYNSKNGISPATANAIDLAVRFATTLQQFGKLWKVAEPRIVHVEAVEGVPVGPVAAKPAKAWKTASQLWVTRYLEITDLAKLKAEPIAALVGNTPSPDDLNTGIVHDAFLLEKLAKGDGTGYDATKLTSFIKDPSHADALTSLVAGAKVLIADTKASLLDMEWKTRFDAGGSCLSMVEELVRAKSPDRAAPSFLRLHGLGEEATVNRLGEFGKLINLAADSGGTLTAALTTTAENMTTMIDFARSFGKTSQCSYFPEAKIFCLGWDSGAVVEKREGGKYFLKTIYVHDKSGAQTVHLFDKSQLAAGDVKAAIPAGQHKCIADVHKDGDCSWKIYDMAARNLELSRLLTVSVSACSVACVWDEGTNKILVSHVNAAAPIPVGMMAHREAMATGPKPLRMMGSFYGSASEKKKFVADLPYTELPFSRVLFSRSTKEFEPLESPPALCHPVTGLELTPGSPSWVGEYGASGLGGIVGGVKILLGIQAGIEPMRKDLVFLTQDAEFIDKQINANLRRISTKPPEGPELDAWPANKIQWAKENTELTKQKTLVGKCTDKIGGTVVLTQKMLEAGTYGFGPVWKTLFDAVKTKDTLAPLMKNDITEVGATFESYLKLKLPADAATKRAAMLLFLYLQTGKQTELNAPIETAFMAHYTKFKLPLNEVAFGKLVAAVPRLT